MFGLSINDLWSLATSVLLVVLVLLIISPFESLGWWVWSDKSVEKLDIKNNFEVKNKVSSAKAYVIYLSGIGAIDDDQLLESEQKFINQVSEQLPGVVFITDIFPYSLQNNGLNGDRVFRRIWKWLISLKQTKSRAKVMSAMINLRNGYQVAMSADSRYGSYYNYGTARVVFELLLANGYDPMTDSSTPIILIGSSGGAQMALGAFDYLHTVVDSPMTMVSLGGMFVPSKDYLKLTKFYHILGQNDSPAKLIKTIIPARWGVSGARWQRFKDSEKYKEIMLPGIAHNGPNGYMGEQSGFAVSSVVQSIQNSI